MMIAVDIDDTIKPYGKPIPQSNIDAMRYFTQNGGLFTLATGRSICATFPAVKELGLTGPVVVNNGATAYDYAKDEILFSTDLDDYAYIVIKKLMERFPTCGIEVYNGKKLCILRRTEMTDMRLKRFDIGQMIYEYDTLESCAKPWQKALAAADEKTADEIDGFFRTLYQNKVLFMRTSPHYCELVPVNATKADGVKKLARMLGISRIFTAGDHNNDVDLLKAGEISFAPSNAIDAAKAAADVVGCHCGEGIVAYMVDYIEKHLI